MITNPHLSTILDAMSRLMDGQPFPSGASEDTDKLQKALGTFTRHPTDADLRMLGIMSLDLLIGRARASLEAERVMAGLGGGPRV